MTDIALTPLDKHGDRLLSIPNWDSIPNGSVFTKKDDNTLEFVSPLGDETIGLQAYKSITIVNGVLTGKGAAITPIADGTVELQKVKSVTTVNGLVTGKGDPITPIADGTITLSAVSAITTVNGIITGTTPA